VSNTENSIKRKIGLERYRKYNINLALQDEKMKNRKHVEAFNKNLWEAGIIWFNEGLTLDEVDDELRGNISFIRGFEYAERLKHVNDNFEVLGAEWFLSGNEIETAHDSNKNHPYFIKGYNDAMNKSKRKG